MTQLRLAVIAGIILFAGAAQAATAPLTQEEARIAAARKVGPAEVDLSRSSIEYFAAQQRALQVPDSDRGQVIAAAISSSNPVAPSRVDARFRR